jgi:hypothetical protein
MQARRKTLVALAPVALALVALSCEPGVSQGLHPHRLHHNRLRFLYHPPQTTQPVNPFPGIPQNRQLSLPPPSPDIPTPYPEGNYPGFAPSFPEGMAITVTKILNDEPGSSDKPDSEPINRPKQAAERLATCWRPPIPDRGDSVEVTLRFSFTRTGNVRSAPRVTYIKAGQGAAADQKSAADNVRTSILAALKACTPLHFTRSMAESAPGYPLSVRFIGRRDEQTGSRH